MSLCLSNTNQILFKRVGKVGGSLDSLTSSHHSPSPHTGTVRLRKRPSEEPCKSELEKFICTSCCAHRRWRWASHQDPEPHALKARLVPQACLGLSRGPTLHPFQENATLKNPFMTCQWVTKLSDSALQNRVVVSLITQEPKSTLRNKLLNQSKRLSACPSSQKAGMHLNINMRFQNSTSKL